MDKSKLGKVIFSLVMGGLFLILAATEAAAVPSFARQTGQDCYACHTVFPELTPIGRAFKLTGYVLNKKGTKTLDFPPIAGMAQFSYTNTRSSQPPGSLTPNIWSLHSLSSGNDVIGSPQQLQFVLRRSDIRQIGAFIQWTYCKHANQVSWTT